MRPTVNGNVRFDGEQLPLECAAGTPCEASVAFGGGL